MLKIIELLLSGKPYLLEKLSIREREYRPRLIEHLEYHLKYDYKLQVLKYQF